MPKGKIYKIPVNKAVFMSVVKKCGSSIIKLGKCEEIDCTERTIRRSLNEGQMTPCFLDQIAKHLNVDPRLLSGEFHKQAESFSDDFFRNIYLKRLTVDKNPYFQKRKSDLIKQPMRELIEQVLSLFDISISQYDAFDFESQHLFQLDLFYAIIPVVQKHFSEDAYGQKDMPNLERIIFELENYREDYYLHQYAEDVLRKNFLKDPPKGKTKADIYKMTSDDLIALDFSLNYGDNL